LALNLGSTPLNCKFMKRLDGKIAIATAEPVASAKASRGCSLPSARVRCRLQPGEGAQGGR